MKQSPLPAPVAALVPTLLPLDADDTNAGVEYPHFSAAAVLVLLFPGPQGPCFFLTARPHTLSRHPGQISLPGGRMEPEDASLLHTALRETEEELGVPGELLTPLGRLETLFMSRSGYAIAPFVVWTTERPPVVPQASEVDEVIEVPLTALLDPSVIEQETWQYNGQDWQITYFRFGIHQVWGATARILDDLARRLGAPDAEHRFRPGDVRGVDRQEE